VALTAIFEPVFEHGHLMALAPPGADQARARLDPERHGQRGLRVPLEPTGEICQVTPLSGRKAAQGVFLQTVRQAADQELAV
jgi:hypothetical protein